MAVIERFEQRPVGRSRSHKRVVCGYGWFDLEGERVLQLETYGSRERKMPDKVSQSLRLDRRTAKELKALIESAFPGI
jgi:hypothetical protein